MLRKGRWRKSREDNEEIESNMTCVYEQFGLC